MGSQFFSGSAGVIEFHRQSDPTIGQYNVFPFPGTNIEK